jgi:hypothetical protein
VDTFIRNWRKGKKVEPENDGTSWTFTAMGLALPGERLRGRSERGDEKNAFQ